MNFKGHFETTHLERGQSFGIPKLVYCFLAQAGITAAELGGVEPQELTPHSDGPAGCVLFMWGKRYSFFISVDCSVGHPPERTALGLRVRLSQAVPSAACKLVVFSCVSRRLPINQSIFNTSKLHHGNLSTQACRFCETGAYFDVGKAMQCLTEQRFEWVKTLFSFQTCKVRPRFTMQSEM